MSITKKRTGLLQKLGFLRQAEVKPNYGVFCVAKVKTIAIIYATATHSSTFQAKTAKIDPSRF